jgi:hypothetical protein
LTFWAFYDIITALIGGMVSMMNDLLSCLNIYKILIVKGLIPLNYQEKSKKVLEKINELERLINERKILNDFDFKGLKRDVSSIFHPDHFCSVPGIIDDVDGTLGQFNGAISSINKYIKEGNTLRGEQNTSDKKSASNSSSKYSYDDENDTNLQNTIFTHISERFNALFRNIPSNEKDYEEILGRFNRKIEKLKEQYDNTLFEIEVIKRRINSNNIDRYHATSPKKVNEKYNQLCDKLYNTANRLYSIKTKRKEALDSRYYELTPLMYAKEQEWNYRYTALLREHEQLTKDYQKAVSQNDRKQIRALTKKLNEINIVIAEEAKILRDGIQKSVKEEVLASDYSYQDLLKKFNIANKRFIEADKRFERTSKNPDISREQIRKSIEEEYSAKARKLTDSLIKAENKINTLDGEIDKTEEEREIFIRKYKMYSPKRKRK